MVGVFELWLPILLSAVLVFVMSSVIHMVLQVHNKDYGKLPGEEEVLAAMRAQSVGRGHYVFPHAGSMKEMGSPEMVEKQNRGPVGFMTVLPNGPPAMGKSLLHWFLFTVVVSTFAAYIGGQALAPGAGGADVLRVTGAVAILGHALSSVPDSIWKGLRWGITARYVVDGIIYGLVTAATFAWLWPGP